MSKVLEQSFAEPLQAEAAEAVVAVAAATARAAVQMVMAREDLIRSVWHRIGQSGFTFADSGRGQAAGQEQCQQCQDRND